MTILQGQNVKIIRKNIEKNIALSIFHYSISGGSHGNGSQISNNTLSNNIIRLTELEWMNLNWGQSRRRGKKMTVKWTGCGFDPHSRKWNTYLHLYFDFFVLVSRQSAVLSSATQHVMLPDYGGKWGSECLNTKFPLPALLCAGYSVKLIWFLNINVVSIFVILFSISRFA